MTKDFDPTAAGLLYSEEREALLDVPTAQQDKNAKFMENFERTFEKKKPNLTEGQTMELCRRAHRMLDVRNLDHAELGECVIPVLTSGDELMRTLDDALTVTTSKIIYTVIPAEGINWRDGLAMSHITGFKTYDLLPGEAPIVPACPFILDVSKDFAPAYIRQEKDIADIELAKFDEGKDYQRTIVVPEESLDLYQVSAEFDQRKPHVNSLAQQTQLHKPELASAMMLGINAKKPYPSQEQVNNAHRRYKNFSKVEQSTTASQSK